MWAPAALPDRRARAARDLDGSVAAAAVTAVATAAATAATIFARARDVHLEVATVEGLAVELLDRCLRLFGGAHLDEAEAARAPRVAIGDDGRAVHRAERREQLRQV